MVKTNRGWFLVVDAGGARLLQTTVVPPGRRHVAEHASIAGAPLDVEHGRPSALRGKEGTYASGGHEAEEELHRLAKTVGVWLDEQVARQRIETLTLFCAPRLLGALRKVLEPGLAQRIDARPTDLSSLSAASLARHPAILALDPGADDEAIAAGA